MAHLKKTILGRLSGTVGDVVFRNKHGRNFVSSKPASFNSPSDEASQQRRARFGLTIKYARAVSQLPQLKDAWYPFKPVRMSINNFIIRENYPHITHEDIANSALIVPGSGFGVAVTSLDITEQRLRVDLDPLGAASEIDPLVEVNLRIAGVVYLSSPLETTSKSYAFLSLVSNTESVDLDNSLSMIANLSNQQALLFNQYQNAKVFCSLLTFSAEDKVVRFSSTFTS